MLGPLLKYRDGRPVGPEIVAWFHVQMKENPSGLAEWAKGKTATWPPTDKITYLAVTLKLFQTWSSLSRSR